MKVAVIVNKRLESKDGKAIAPLTTSSEPRKPFPTPNGTSRASDEQIPTFSVRHH